MADMQYNGAALARLQVMSIEYIIMYSTQEQLVHPGQLIFWYYA